MNEPVKLTLDAKRLLLSILKQGEITETTGQQLADYLRNTGIVHVPKIVFVDSFDNPIDIVDE